MLLLDVLQDIVFIFYLFGSRITNNIGFGLIGAVLLCINCILKLSISFNLI
jgi:hypothetical protein